ncbi:MAG: hypothetical protein EXR77_09890 [Myxococcales bacterium]|nr:hypothetical protein [Myxococcales bacterium]
MIAKTGSLLAWAVAAIVLSGGPVYATEGEREWSIAAMAGSSGSDSVNSQWLAGLDGQLLFHASDFWALGATVRPRFAAGRAAVALDATARWTLDALQWIPSVAAGVGGQFATENSALSLAMRAEGSLTWRAQRAWGISARVAVESAVSTNEPMHWLAGIGYVRYWGAGVGVDL